MKKAIVAAVLLGIILASVLASCGSDSLAGSTWTGKVALTTVTVTFNSAHHYTSDHFSSGKYVVHGGKVTLSPSSSGTTRVFKVDGSVMQGSVDGWSCKLTKQTK